MSTANARTKEKPQKCRGPRCDRRLFVSREGFRCVECGRVYCRPCAVAHFADGKGPSNVEIGHAVEKVSAELGNILVGLPPSKRKTVCRRAVRSAIDALRMWRLRRMLSVTPKRERKYS